MAPLLQLFPRQQTSNLPAANTNTDNADSNTQSTSSTTQLTGQTFMHSYDTYVSPVVIIWAIVFCLAWVVAIGWAYAYNRGYHIKLPKRSREKGGKTEYQDQTWDRTSDRTSDRSATLPPYSPGGQEGHNDPMVRGGPRNNNNNNLRPPPR